MSRINTNISSLIAQRVLARNNQSLSTSLQRLSTGLKINTGADDPAGLIASENLRAEKTGITTAIDNAQRATNIVGTAEGGLNEVSSLLTQLQGLVGQTANSGGLSDEEVQANQLQVDSILSTINRISQATSFEGKKLLNGNLSYTTSGVTSSDLANVQVNAAKLPDGASVNLVVAVTASAKTGQVTYTGGDLSATNGVTISVAGNKGTQQLSFAGGTAQSAIAAAINGVTGTTGVSAVVVSGDLQLNSTTFGSDQFVSLKTISGSFATASNYGTDATVSINGAATTTKGLNVTYRSADLDVELDLATAFNTAGSTNFYITGGGATFALGSKVTESDKASLGIQSVDTGSLGDNVNGFLSTLATGQTNSLASGNLVTAQNILDKAIKQVSQLRGRLGSFQKYTLGSTINNLGVAYENASAAESAIRDTDFASETASMTRSQILTQASTTILAQANAQPQLALTLLRG
jgi:flagellin